MKWNRTARAQLSRLVPLLACALTFHGALTAAEPARWWTNAIEPALVSSGDNRAELTKALVDVPVPQREGMSFLIENMPRVDLESLSAAYLLDHVAQGYEAMAGAPWARDVPREIFLNDVLPYASLNEARDGGRRRLRELSAPLVKECRTPGEAAQLLNRKLFRLVNVRYSTQRKKPDQSPLESISSGLATCSGLAILLVDACRSVGVPARIVGTPMWTNLRGNHTWVEVWDGDWHFTGAAEPDPNGLDRGWFKGDAAKARGDVPRHAIYASSFKKSGLSFPLVWNRRIDWVNAVNVTDKYAPTTSAPAIAGDIRVLVRVLDRDGGKRVAARVTVTDPADTALKLGGTSRDESADLNNILPFQLARDRTYGMRVEHGQNVVERALKTTADPEQIVTIALGE
jgi:transglutaminase-like putative cysteine protease